MYIGIHIYYTAICIRVHCGIRVYCVSQPQPRFANFHHCHHFKNERQRFMEFARHTSNIKMSQLSHTLFNYRLFIGCIGESLLTNHASFYKATTKRFAVYQLLPSLSL